MTKGGREEKEKRGSRKVEPKNLSGGCFLKSSIKITGVVATGEGKKKKTLKKERDLGHVLLGSRISP